MESEKKISSEIDGKVVMVTGGTGSFGHQIVDELLKLNPKQIIIFSRDEDKQYKMRLEYQSEKLKFVIGDVRDFDRVLEATYGVDVIFHAAALKHVPYCEFHPYEAVKTNVIGAHNVKRAAILNNVSKLIAISTDKAVKPVNAMGMSKALQEKTLLSNGGKENNTTIAFVRYGNVVGSRGSVVPFFKEKVLKNEPLPITHQDMTRFLLTLPQSIQLVFYALKTAKGGEIFVKKSPSCRIVELAKVMAEALTGKEDYPIKIVGVRPGEKIHEILVSEEEIIRTDEKEEYFIIYPHEKFFDPNTRTLFDSLTKIKVPTIKEYSSTNTTMLDEKEILEILKSTGWVS